MFFLVYRLSSSCPILKVLDLSNSSFDEEMADLLCGWKKIIRKGDLYKIIAVNNETRKPPLFQQSLALLDLRNTQIGVLVRGLSTLRHCFNDRSKIKDFSLDILV